MFQKLHEQAKAKMSLTFIIAALKAEKLQKPKCGLFFKHPVQKKSALYGSFVGSALYWSSVGSALYGSSVGQHFFTSFSLCPKGSVELHLKAVLWNCPLNCLWNWQGFHFQPCLKSVLEICWGMTVTQLVWALSCMATFFKCEYAWWRVHIFFPMNSQYVKPPDWIIGVKSHSCVMKLVQLCGQKVRLVTSSHFLLREDESRNMSYLK